MNKGRSHSTILRWIKFPFRFYYKWRLKGKQVRCNVCGNTYKRFRPFGQKKRDNALCPDCFSLESTRLLWFYLRNEVLGQKNKNNFLYFSPEQILLKKLKEFEVSVEVSNLAYLKSIHRIKPEDKIVGGKQDVILFSHVLQYLNDEELILEELKRLLRPGGFVLMVTIINWDMERSYENPKTAEDKDRLHDYFEPGFKRIYGSDFQKHLLKAGFEVEVIDYADQLGIFARNYYQLGSGTREMIFKCKKV